MSTSKIKSEELKLALKRAFPSPGWQVFYEVANDTGVRASRRADAVAIGIWPSNGHLIHGFEIKVSRSDFLNEMKNPTKSQEVFQFCDRWSLVTPIGMVKADELPAPWGLMTFGGNTLRTVKKAPQLDRQPLTPGFVAAMLRKAGEADDRLLEAALRVEREQALTAREIAVRDAIARDRERRMTAAENDLKELAAYREAFKGMSRFEVQGLAPYVKLAKLIGTEDGMSKVRYCLQSLERCAKDMKDVVESIDEDDLL